MIVSWLRPARQHGICLPCALFSTCLVCLSLPPTLCVGMLYAKFKDGQAKRRKRSESTGSDCKDVGTLLKQGRPRSISGHGQDSGSASGTDLSLEGERRLWLLALFRFFGDTGLRDIGPLVWRFLDDQPWALRVALEDGSVRDLPLHSAREPSLRSQVMGEVLGMLPEKIASSAGHMLVLADIHAAASGRQPETALQPCAGGRVLLEGHQGDVTCFSAASDGGDDDLIVTGSTDMTVRLWRGGQCLKSFVGLEWSEWTGTIYIGHVTTVTAVLVTPEGRIASGDRFGAVCVWRQDESCEMLDLPPMGAVTCLAAGPGDGFLVGHRDGDVRAASWDAAVLAVWSGAGARLLAVVADPGGGRVLAASAGGLAQAFAGGSFSRLVFFPEPASVARFEGGALVACGLSAVTIWALDGRALATVPVAEVRAATLLFVQGQQKRELASADKDE